MKRLIVVLLVLAMLLGSIPLFARSAITGTPYLSGTFLQPPLVTGWTDTDWNEEFQLMKDVGMDHMILQWTAETRDKTTIYPTSIPAFSNIYSYDVVEKALQKAEAAGIDIYLGLQLNHDIFSNYANNVTWLNQEATYSEQIVQELWTRYSTYSAFKGWYITFEVDNWNYNLNSGSTPDTNKLQNLVNYYNRVVNLIRTLDSANEKKVMTAPFYNINPDTTVLQPYGWRTMWKYILERVDFNIIALQDGIGAGHAETNQIAEWYEATFNAIRDAGKDSICELWSDVETFNTDWQPLPTNTIVADMNAVKPYVTKYTSFSFNHYMSPKAVDPEYYNTYKNYYETGSVETSKPSTPLNLIGEALDSATISMSWGASTDNIGVVGYNIYRNGILVKKTYDTGSTYNDTQLKGNTQYQYTIAARDAAGNESEKSNTLNITTPSDMAFKTKYSGAYTYSIAPNGQHYTDPSRNKLTDGLFGGSATNQIYEHWVGLEGSGPFNITFDLGSANMINKVSLNFLQINAYYIILPSEIKVETSIDGITYSSFGTISAAAVDDTNQSKGYQLVNLTGATARYVRFTIYPSGAAWTFLDEVEIWGGYDTVSVTGITLDRTTASLIEGAKTTLAATVKPSNAANKEVTWISDRPDIATVDNGVVTAISQGTATITATTTDGSITASCIVTVLPYIELQIEDIEIFGTKQIGSELTFKTITAGGVGTLRYSFYIIGDGKIHYEYRDTLTNTYTFTPYLSKNFTVIAFCTDIRGNKNVKIIELTLS